MNYQNRSQGPRGGQGGQGQGGGNYQQMPMIQGNWTCSECNTAITELPFEPAPDRPIYCRECWRQKKDSRPSRPHQRY